MTYIQRAQSFPKCSLLVVSSSYSGLLVPFSWRVKLRGHMLGYRTILHKWSICQHIWDYPALYESRCRHTAHYKPDVDIRAHLHNLNHMSAYETILRIINPSVDIRNLIAHYEEYANIWNYITSYELYANIWNHTIQYESYANIWTHTVQWKPYVNIWNHIAHCKSICWHTESYCTIWIICWPMKYTV